MRFPEAAVQALNAFSSVLGLFAARVKETPPDPVLRPKKDLDRLLEQTQEIGEAAAPLRNSLKIINETVLDIVDLESRVRRESAKLAGELAELDRLVFRQGFIRQTFESLLIPLEESAQDLAGALFPCASRDLCEVNEDIWEFTRVQLTRFAIEFAKVIQQGRLGLDEQREVTQGFGRLEALFNDADELLNQLALSELKGRDEVTARLRRAKQSIAEALTLSGQLKEKQSFKPFRGILGETAKIARKVAREIGKLEIPIFPPHVELGDLKGSITERDYGELPGLGAFAMLNIASRMRGIGLNGNSLLDAGFGINVTRVFPDRIYFEADSSLEVFFRELEGTGELAEAPAGLHRYNFRSLKQNRFSEGNLQLSYTRPHSGRFKVDADIDLYRNPVAHLFGEVFVNHFTGSKTDQFKIFNILRKQHVNLIGDFDILRT